MTSRRYVALLRGINVGGRNTIPMAELRAAFDAAGFQSVATYIQSGNVVFSADGGDLGELESSVEQMLEQRFGVPLVVVVREHRQLRRVVQHAPEGFGAAPDRYHSDVIFLKAPLTAERAMAAVRLREGVDAAWPGTGVLYFQRLSSGRTRSLLSKIMVRPEYQQMTIRNWATTTRLLALLDTPGEPPRSVTTPPAASRALGGRAGGAGGGRTDTPVPE